MIDQAGAARRIEDQFFEGLHQCRRVEVDAVELPIDSPLPVDDRCLGEVIEALRARVEKEAEVFAQCVNGACIASEKMPAVDVRGALLRRKLSHTIGRVDLPVKTDGHNRERVVTERFTGNVNGVDKGTRDHRTHMVTTRVDHAYDERSAAKPAEVERLAVDVAKPIVAEAGAHGRLAHCQRRILVVVARRAGRRRQKEDDCRQAAQHRSARRCHGHASW